MLKKRGHRVLTFWQPSPKMDAGAFSGQRQGWKTPKRTPWQCTASVCVVGVHCWEISLGLADPWNVIFCLLCLSFTLCAKLQCLCVFSHLFCAPCRLRGCKNRPASFPGRMSYTATKPGLVCVLYLSMLYIVLLLVRAPFVYCQFSLVCVLSFGCSS